MEKVFLKPCYILSMFLVIAIPSLSTAGGSVLVENNSFAVITEDYDKKEDEKCCRAAILIQNNSCLITYTVSFGDSTLGSGEFDAKRSPQTIKLGKSRLHFGCQIQGNVRVTKFGE